MPGMPQNTCEAVAIHCIDFRVQEYLDDWLTGRFGRTNYDRVALAGAVRNLALVIEQVRIAFRLHDVKTAVLINHEDCGAYGAEGNKKRHAEDLSGAKRQLEVLFPGLHVEAYYLHLDGTFEPVASSG